MNIAVLGLFNSGSTAIAGVLHKLGVNMGPPYWRGCYESLALKRQLTIWWEEPKIVEKVSRNHRISTFTAWLNYQKKRGNPIIGLKHPLLCLSGYELIEAWGEETRFIWAYRPLDESIERLRLRKWYRDPASLQRKLWSPVRDFMLKEDHLRVECNAMRENTACEVSRIIEYLNLSPTEDQINDALNIVQPPGT